MAFESTTVVWQELSSYDAKPDACTPRGCMKVSIDRTTGKPLGIDVNPTADLTGLMVVGLTGGLLEAWNDQHPGKSVRRGDVIIRVNGLYDDVHSMVKECTRDALLELWVEPVSGEKVAPTNCVMPWGSTVRNCVTPC